MPDDDTRDSPEGAKNEKVRVPGPVPGWQPGWWAEWGDLVLAVAIGALIGSSIILSGDNVVLALSLLIVGLVAAPLVLAFYYRHTKPFKKKRIFISALYFFVAFLIFLMGVEIIINPYPTIPPGQSAERGACQDNLRTIDSAIMQYEAAHGEGVYPRTVESLYPDFLPYIPEEPSGGMYYIDITKSPPRSVCTEGHTY